MTRTKSNSSNNVFFTCKLNRSCYINPMTLGQCWVLDFQLFHHFERNGEFPNFEVKNNLEYYQIPERQLLIISLTFC